MRSGPVSFEQVLAQVKMETGFSNLRPLYSSIRSLIFWGTKDIGYGDTIVQRTNKYEAGNEFFDGRILQLPDDFVELDKVGCCKEMMFEGCDYNVQGKYLFLCRPKKDIQIKYSTYICDGRGNPVISYNHFKAVVAYIVWKLYSKKKFLGKGNLSLDAKYEQDFERYAAAAVGNDALPVTPEDWLALGSLNRMSSFDALVHLQDGKCCGCAPKNIFKKPEEGEDTMENKEIYYWQFDDLSKTIDFAPQIDQAFLDTKDTVTLGELNNGVAIPYIGIGRVAFAITGTQPGLYTIRDILGQDITENVFDSHYDFGTETEIFISKEHYTHSTIFYKFEN